MFAAEPSTGAPQGFNAWMIPVVLVRDYKWYLIGGGAILAALYYARSKGR